MVHIRRNIVDKEFSFSCRILGLNENFTYDELKDAYRQCVGKYHPDLYANAPIHEKQHINEIMKHIHYAYEYLKTTFESAPLESNNSNNIQHVIMPDEDWRDILGKKLMKMPTNVILTAFNNMVKQWNVLNNTFDKALKSHADNNNVDITYIYLAGLKSMIIETLRFYIEFALTCWPNCNKIHNYLSDNYLNYFDDLHQSDIDWMLNLTEKNKDIFFDGYHQAILMLIKVGGISMTHFREYVTMYIGRDWDGDDYMY
jgi:hypothetical protein